MINFSTNENSRENEIQLFHFFTIEIDGRLNTDAEKILLAFVVPSKLVRKKFFLIKIFWPIRIREKIQFNYSTFSQLESRDQWTLMLKKSYWLLFDVRNRWEKNFFSSKFFDQSNFEKKWNSVIRLFYNWNRRTSEQWCWKNSIDLCCIHEIREKKIFFLKNFSTNQNSRKNEIQFFHFFTIEIEGRVNTDAEKILLTFVVFSKSVRKNFFL